jgi:hypothetical protein
MAEAIIKLRHGDGRTEERSLRFGRYGIRRDAGRLVLGDPDFSAFSAEFELDIGAGLVSIIDLGSRNGGSQRSVAQHQLSLNEPIPLGVCTIVLLRVIPASGAAQSPRQGPFVNEQQSAARGARTSGSTGGTPRTQAAYDDAVRQRQFWQALVNLVGAVLTCTLVVFLVLTIVSVFGALQYPGMLISGTTSVVEGGVLKLLLSQRDSARAIEAHARYEAQLGTGAIREIHLRERSNVNQSPVGATSLWRSFRGLPIVAQLVIALYAWWALIPLWYIDQQRTTPERNRP